MITKTVPGPNFKVDNSLPCGCRICRDDDTKKLRLWYCPTHATAFETLEALRRNADALDTVMKRAPSDLIECDAVRDAETRARTVIRRASGGAW
jgi:hypothetical protein